MWLDLNLGGKEARLGRLGRLKVLREHFFVKLVKLDAPRLGVDSCPGLHLGNCARLSIVAISLPCKLFTLPRMTVNVSVCSLQWREVA